MSLQEFLAYLFKRDCSRELALQLVMTSEMR